MIIIVARASGPGVPTYPQARRVSFSELLGSAENCRPKKLVLVSGGCPEKGGPERGNVHPLLEKRSRYEDVSILV